MKQKLSCLTLSIALLASSNWCNAANRYVSAGSDGDGLSWATAKGSIKSAVESCHTGDTVFVSSGLYNEYVSIVDGINILGGYNADTGARDIETFETILDGTGLGKYLIVKYDSPCENPTLIEGLTLQNAEHSSDGGAAYIRANITLSKCRIKNCKGQNGGGVFNDGGIIKDCIIELCSSTSSGGAIRNSGGIVENCIMRGNQGKYGTIRNENGGIVRNCIIHNNSATVSGWPNSGGIYNPSGIVANCIIACNYGSQYAAIHSEGKTINTICWNNQAEEGFGDPIAFIEGNGSSHNAAVSGFADAKDALTLSSINTDATGPNFKSPTLFIGIPTSAADIEAMRAADWTFSNNSPCIDKGFADNDAPTYDIKGTVRPKGAEYDLGAYEYDPEAKDVAVQSVSLTLKSLSIEEEQQQWLSAIVLPSDASNKKVSWNSLNNSIAVVEGGLVTGKGIGETKIIVTTLDGNFKDTCHVTVTEKPVIIIHPDVLEADKLSQDDYTIPSYIKMLMAKEAARADSSQINLLALKEEVQALVPKGMPYCVVTNINGDPSTRMAFTWFTNSGISSGKVQIVAKSNAVESDFTNATEIEAAHQAANNLNYAVSTSGILKAAALPANTKFNYTSHKAIATGLTPNTTYSYRVGYDGNWSNIKSFITANTNKEEFKFLYMTDSHIMDNEYVENARWSAITAAKQAPDAKFLLFTGDFVETGTEQNSEWEWEQWFEVSMKPLLSRMALAPTDGNHDDTPNLNYTYHFNTDKAFNETATVKPQFDGITYSFVYGDALFMVYSHQDFWRGSYSYANGTSTYLSNDVANWFRDQVEKYPDTKWRIAAVHKNLFTGSGHQADEDGALFRATLLPVFQELNIDFVIQGHDHIYEVMGPINNTTKTIVPGRVTNVELVSPDSNKNPKGQQGGTFNVKEGTLYFVNGTCGRKRYYPYTQDEMEAGFDKHKVEGYWDLFTGKYGQPGAPAFSEISVSSSEIEVKTYTSDANAQATLFDTFKIVKNGNTGIEENKQSAKLYPTYAKDKINTTESDIIRVNAIDLTGKIYPLPFDNQHIDVSNLTDGIYVVQIFTNEKTRSERIVKTSR